MKFLRAHESLKVSCKVYATMQGSGIVGGIYLRFINNLLKYRHSFNFLKIDITKKFDKKRQKAQFAKYTEFNSEYQLLVSLRLTDCVEVCSNCGRHRLTSDAALMKTRNSELNSPQNTYVKFSTLYKLKEWRIFESCV